MSSPALGLSPQQQLALDHMVQQFRVIEGKCQFWIGVSTALAMKLGAQRQFVTIPAKYMLDSVSYGILVENSGNGDLHIRLQPVGGEARKEVDLGTERKGENTEQRVKRYDWLGQEIVDPDDN